MSIGATIKKLRRQRDMTQEQLAEFLGITANAVSQWECDRTTPDISQLPALANIFRVSADVLLGIDVETKDARIEEIYQEIQTLWCTGQREQAEKICREGLAQFPDSYILMEELAHCLSQSGNQAKVEESIALFERIRTAANDENAKNYAIGNLCWLYMKVGKQETAKQLVESIPSPIYTKEECRLTTLRGEEWAYELRHQIELRFNSFIWKLNNLTQAFKEDHPLFTEEERLVLWQKAIDMVKLFYENGDYHYDEQLIIEAHFKRSRIFITLGEQEAALSELEKMFTHITHFDAYSAGMLGGYFVLPPEKWHTSLLVRPRNADDGSTAIRVSGTRMENAATEYLKKLSDSKFDSIRNQPRFVAVMEELQKTAHA